MDKGQFDFWFKTHDYSWTMLNVCREELASGNPVPVSQYEEVMRNFYPAYKWVVIGQMRESRASCEWVRRELAFAFNYKLIEASLYEDMVTKVTFYPVALVEPVPPKPITPQDWTPDSFGPQEESKLADKWWFGTEEAAGQRVEKPGKPKDPPAPFSMIELD
jgi:hypothetical protein